MPRQQPRKQSESGVYHVGNRGARRLLIFGDDQDRYRFLDLLGTAAERFEADIYAYCLVDNHYHLLLKADPEPLWRTMQLAGSTYVRSFNRRYGLDGSLWNDRFWSDPIEDDRQLLNVARYIERNALAMRADGQPQRYQWSSLGAIVGRRRAPRFLDSDFVLDIHGGDGDRYLEFVTTHLPNDPEPNSPGPLLSSKTLSSVRSAVTAAIGAAPGDRPTDRKATTERELVLLLSAKCCEASTDELAAELGIKTAGSVHSIRSRAKRREASDPDFASLAAVARSMLRAA